MFLADTNLLSELRKLSKADAKVTAWASATPLDDIYVSAITILELEIGVLGMERRDPLQGAVLRDWLDNQILPRFEGRVLVVDVAVARRGARLHVPDPRSEHDALIAATALVHGLTVVTRNVADFAPTGAPILNPWT